MIDMRWFDRKFNFENLEGTFPSILERLEGTPLRLKHKIQTIPPEHYQVSVGSTWSIQEHVGHLGDLEDLWEKRCIDFIQKRSVLTEADLANQKTHNAKHNQHDMQELLNAFEKQRVQLCGFLRSLSKNAEIWHSKHPRLQSPMRPIDLAYFVAEHDDHHLAAISKIHEQLSE